MAVLFLPQSILDKLQAARARSDTNVSLIGQPVAERLSGAPANIDRSDWASPQLFTTHPDINQSINTTAVVTSDSWPHLPGRPPGAAFDGEPGAPLGSGY